MIEASERFYDLLLQDHITKVRIGITGGSGTERWFDEDWIISLKTSVSALGESSSSPFGGCMAGQMDLTMIYPDNYVIPKMAKIRIQIALAKNDTSPKSEWSEWVDKGTYFIDTRKIDLDDNTDTKTITIHAYDGILKTGTAYRPVSVKTWPATDKVVAQDIAGIIGTTVDPRTLTALNKGYELKHPNQTIDEEGVNDQSMLCREVLNDIAAAYVGNWVMNNKGQLRLVLLGDLPDETWYLVDNIGRAILFGDTRILVR